MRLSKTPCMLTRSYGRIIPTELNRYRKLIDWRPSALREQRARKHRRSGRYQKIKALRSPKTKPLEQGDRCLTLARFEASYKTPHGLGGDEEAARQWPEHRLPTAVDANRKREINERCKYFPVFFEKYFQRNVEQPLKLKANRSFICRRKTCKSAKGGCRATQ